MAEVRHSIDGTFSRLKHSIKAEQLHTGEDRLLFSWPLIMEAPKNTGHNQKLKRNNFLHEQHLSQIVSPKCQELDPGRSLKGPQTRTFFATREKRCAI